MPLRRSRKVQLPGGAHLQTPVLMPSISTRNVGYLEDRDSGEARSLASLVFEWLPGQITESLLISAFDLGRGELGNLGELFSPGARTTLREPELLMVDSGQYEARQRPPVGPFSGDGMPWSPEEMLKTYRGLPAELPVALVNWDDQDVPYPEQVRRAQTLFADLPGRASVMLLKPDQHRNAIEPAKISGIAADLRHFSIIGVTEKELGQTLGDRLRTLAELRRVLDHTDVSAPLHVFGGLDPLMTPLYVMCGAEIVDGVGWLRYAYMHDTAHYIENRALLDLDLDSRVPNRTFRTFNENLLYLADAKRRLVALVKSGDLQQYSESRGDLLSKIWQRVVVPAGEA